MHIPNVVSGTDIESAWGNAVADTINGHEADLIDVDAALASHAEAIDVTLPTYVDDSIATHVSASLPHPAYDDIPTLVLLFENGLV